MLTDITIVLDKSGSMGSVRETTEQSFNEFVQEQKNVAGEALLTLIQFDSKAYPTFTGVPIADVPYTGYSCGGMTAMLDAIGAALVAADERARARPTARMLFCIITDGHENASKEYTRQQILAMIKERTEEKQWDFLFLGANIVSGQVAGDIGIQENTAADFTQGNIGAAMRGTSDKVKKYRCTADREVATSGLAWSDSDREQFTKKT